MADLFVSKSATTEGYVDLWAERGVTLPLGQAPEDVAMVVDAAGRPVLVVDVDRELSDDVAHDLALLIVLAVNTCGGFIAKGPNG